MKKIIIILIILFCVNGIAQVRNNNQSVNNAINGSSAFIDASSSAEWNNSLNKGKGLVFPRTDLTKLTELVANPNGIPFSFPTRLDGMIVYNTANGTSGVGNTAVTPGFYYYKNDSKDLNGGTWIKISDAQAAANLYTQNGALTENRTVNLDNKTLAFTGGQIGINTEKPKATLDIESKDGINNGILIPRVTSAQRDAYDKPERGLMVYNTDNKCYETNNGTAIEPKWECLAVASNTQLLKIEPIGFEGNFRGRTENDPTVNKVKFKVTNNTGSKLTNLDLSYIEVDGETQYVAPGQNDNVSIPAYGSVILTYGISGGNWWNTSTFTLKYDEYSQASIVLHADFHTSIDGQGIGNGGTATFYNTEKKVFMVKQTVGSTSIDKSVTITSTSPFKVQIPFKKGVGNYLKYESEPIDIVDANGDTRQIKLTYPEGNLDPGTGIIDANIASVDGAPLTFKQTTLGEEEVIAQIPLKLNNTNQGFFKLIAFGGIPDRRFGDGSGHDFVYMPVVTASGRTWLNNNLGAEYSRIDSDVFNPEQQAKKIGDIYAYGSKFQQRRYSDGHELYEVVDGEYRPKGQVVLEQSPSFQPNTAKIYFDPKYKLIDFSQRRYDWVNTDFLQANAETYVNLWKVNGANNPCPKGYYVPNESDWEKELSYIEIKSSKGLFEYMKASNGTVVDDGGIRWGRNNITANPSRLGFGGSAQMFTKMVRCIKAE